MLSAISDAVSVIKKSKSMIALTGAGISVESGIPDFRSAGGLWDKYDPAIYASIHSFRNMPERVWEMIFELIDITERAKPNSAHLALANLEEMGLLKAVITQNIDNLHQEAGSKNVIEYHGNAKHLVCLTCGSQYSPLDFDLEHKEIPHCEACGKVLKPSVVFFGEMIPPDALYNSQRYAEEADVVLVVGTSAVVYPAASIPGVVKSHGGIVIEFNLERTELTGSITDIFIQGKAGQTLPQVVNLLKE
ncbi:MAG TPA: NAD-dependent deacylase [Spirochaetota bacterium]|nr:NAD-dependent deacylase [Spirochaetota bacterium]HON16458.1 NAD-dependent deacylase [Spirochaetota bacterium]HPD77869.1 NAD-dependent deacylase [Spirochaetota bacterium]HRS63487.1 NAD-dependent deacylase [Spirochaetota bacterium]HRU64931.1 NAD-dependent deacylase [Spirochaetota bacterium]